MCIRDRLRLIIVLVRGHCLLLVPFALSGKFKPTHRVQYQSSEQQTTRVTTPVKPQEWKLQKLNKTAPFAKPLQSVCNWVPTHQNQCPHALVWFHSWFVVQHGLSPGQVNWFHMDCQATMKIKMNSWIVQYCTRASWKLKAEKSWKLKKAESWKKLKAESWKLKAESWKLKAESWKPKATMRITMNCWIKKHQWCSCISIKY